jgi:tubulin polyglutamylase TTLL6/13
MESDSESFSSESSYEAPPKKSADCRQLTANVANTKYSVVRYVLSKVLGFRLVKDDQDDSCDVYWHDCGVDVERLMRLKPFQKINHYPGMYEVARKNNLARNLNRMRRHFPKEYNFYPQSWLLPSEWSDFAAQFTKRHNKTFIVKPEASCQGKGIFLTRRLEDINRNERYVAQRYLHRPFLLDGLKFDLRIYVLVAGCDPMRVYVHREGLTRLATQPYLAPTGSNMDDMCMHLTNYAVNKLNPNFVFNEDEHTDDIGHKRSLTWTFEFLRSRGYDVDTLWRRICSVIMKTLAVAQPTLAHTYKSCQSDDVTNSMCFELLGFDVILNHNLKPYVLEVNLSPSLATESPLDKKIKRIVLADTLTLMNLSHRHKREYLAKKKAEIQQRAISGRIRETREERQAACRRAQVKRDKYEDQHLGNFQKIYPGEDRDYYDQFIEKAVENYHYRTGVSRFKPREEKVAHVIPTPIKQLAVKGKSSSSKKTLKERDFKRLQSPSTRETAKGGETPVSRGKRPGEQTEHRVITSVFSKLAGPRNVPRSASTARVSTCKAQSEALDPHKDRVFATIPSNYADGPPERQADKLFHKVYGGESRERPTSSGVYRSPAKPHNLEWKLPEDRPLSEVYPAFTVKITRNKY